MVSKGATLFLLLIVAFVATNLSTTPAFAFQDPVQQEQGAVGEAKQDSDTNIFDDPDASAEDVVVNSKGVSFHSPNKVKWKVGVKMATRSTVKGVVITIPIPTPWPEQTVEVVDETVPPEVGKIEYRELNSGVKQIYTKVRTVPAKRILEFDLTFLITVKQIAPPKDPTIFQAPKPIPREVREYIGVGPDITYRNGKIRSEVKSIVKDVEGAWSQTEAIFDWVRDNIRVRDGKKKDTVSTFRDKFGNTEDVVGLFVAMCRANKIPARMVWADGQQYAEFYLWDDEKTGHWFPCSVVGIREFGSHSDTRVILQKGDNIKVPEEDERKKFVPEFVTCKGTSKPTVRFLRELLPAK